MDLILANEENTIYRQKTTVADKTQIWLRDEEYMNHLKILMNETYQVTGDKTVVKDVVVEDIYENSCNYGLETKTAELIATAAYNQVFHTHYSSYSSCYS